VIQTDGLPMNAVPQLAPGVGPDEVEPSPASPGHGCRSCAWTLSAGARFCRRCGTEAQDVLILFGRPCPVCRRRQTPGVNFCRHCGARQPGAAAWAPLRLASPDLSAASTLARGQRRRLLLAGIAALAVLAVAPVATLTVLIGLITVAYIAAFAYRVRMFRLSLRGTDVLTVSDEEARALPDAELPVYTILVPAYREPEVIPDLLAAIDRIEYPRHLLDVKLLLEVDDPETLAAVRAAEPGSHVDIIRVSDGPPKTKPKACNVGLVRARGTFVTIYDAEDRPDPLQLRRAVAAFRTVPDNVVCLQAKLSYYNADQNLLTRWFTAEYALWFGQLLPGLVHDGAPVPLGGTSNHFRRDALMGLGGWDAFNVTEDADLGTRLHRAGLRTLVLESTTYEEANSDFINWVKQRSRWYKGYLQTWLVHMRHPGRLWAELGPSGFVGFNLFVGGTPFLALANPIFWAMTAVWFAAHPAFVAALFPAPLYYAGMFCLAFGNATFLYGTIVSAHLTGRPSLVLAAVLSPLYWAMMSVAAVKALIQLVSVPSFWEKTTHGLDRRRAALTPERPGLHS
jgi:cellulose synthase/poly-beta-1,6-N-acetylglucosamine synthase-like glycosyltransferase